MGYGRITAGGSSYGVGDTVELRGVPELALYDVVYPPYEVISKGAQYNNHKYVGCTHGSGGDYSEQDLYTTSAENELIFSTRKYEVIISPDNSSTTFIRKNSTFTRRAFSGVEVVIITDDEIHTVKGSQLKVYTETLYLKRTVNIPEIGVYTPCIKVPIIDKDEIWLFYYKNTYPNNMNCKHYKMSTQELIAEYQYYHRSSYHMNATVCNTRLMTKNNKLVMLNYSNQNSHDYNSGESIVINNEGLVLKSTYPEFRYRQYGIGFMSYYGAMVNAEVNSYHIKGDLISNTDGDETIAEYKWKAKYDGSNYSYPGSFHSSHLRVKKHSDTNQLCLTAGVEEYPYDIGHHWLPINKRITIQDDEWIKEV